MNNEPETLFDTLLGLFLLSCTLVIVVWFSNLVDQHYALKECHKQYGNTSIVAKQLGRKCMLPTGEVKKLK